MSRLLPLFLVLAALGGCTTFHQSAPEPQLVQGLLKKTWYDAEVTAPDGVKIRFTVYQPAIKPGEKAPLILHSHGFSLTRMKKPRSLYGQFLVAGTSARAAWDQGYWVISFDQRGHGDSQGDVGLIRMNKEAADVSLIIDWAQRNLALSEVKGDPRVGMVGESYAGGVQLLATVRDARIDAIVPLTTWYDLDQALLPNDVPKSDWLLVLAMAGYTMNPGSMDFGMTWDLTKKILFGGNQPFLRRKLQDNSLASHCSHDVGPQADALLIQGMRDVLFPLDQAIAARDCFQRRGRDVRLIAAEHGHLNPSAQLSPGMPVWHLDKHVQCGGKELEVKALILDWFNGKLKDQPTLDAIPRYCLTGDAVVDAAEKLPELHWQNLPKAHVGSGISGMVEWAAQPLDRLGNLFIPAKLPKDWQQPSNGWLRPGRIPLYAADEATWIVGSPELRLDISHADRRDPVLFLRMAVWTPGSGTYRVLNQQVTPVYGFGQQTVKLAGVRAKLEKGEVLGLLAQGWSSQFRLSGSGFGTDASVSGQIGLPLVKAGAEARTAQAR